MKTTLDAWEAFQAVVQLGGFAPAAEQLNRSQSTISYAVARLQEQLGVRLFEQNGRKAQLTEAGRVLLADDVISTVKALKPGQTVRLQVWSAGTKKLVVITLGEQPADVFLQQQQQ